MLNIDNKAANLLLLHFDDLQIHLDQSGSIVAINQAVTTSLGFLKTQLGKNIFSYWAESGFTPPFSFSDIKTKENILPCRFNQKIEMDEKPVLIRWCLDKLLNQAKQQTYILTGRIDNASGASPEEYLKNIISITPGSLYWKDRKGRYLGCNQFMLERANKKTVDEIIGKTDEELWPEFANTLKKNDKQVIETGKQAEFQEAVGLPNGKEMHLSV